MRSEVCRGSRFCVADWPRIGGGPSYGKRTEGTDGCRHKEVFLLRWQVWESMSSTVVLIETLKQEGDQGWEMEN